MNILSRIALAGLVATILLAASPLYATIHNISVGNFFFTPGKTQAARRDNKHAPFGHNTCGIKER